ncbi:MAG: hypothetical protein ACHQ01_08205 [Candidatus Limnocylindrales bacterium]
MYRLRGVSPRRPLLALTVILNTTGVFSLLTSWAGVGTVPMFLSALGFFTVAESALGLVLWDYHKEVKLLKAKVEKEEDRQKARDILGQAHFQGMKLTLKKPDIDANLEWRMVVFRIVIDVAGAGEGSVFLRAPGLEKGLDALGDLITRFDRIVIDPRFVSHPWGWYVEQRAQSSTNPAISSQDQT